MLRHRHLSENIFKRISANPIPNPYSKPDPNFGMSKYDVMIPLLAID